MAWHNGYQVWLTEQQSLENGQLVANFLLGKGWTPESISATLGNMRHESSVNPNMYEYGKNWADDWGFGLVQWTPLKSQALFSTKFPYHTITYKSSKTHPPKTFHKNINSPLYKLAPHGMINITKHKRCINGSNY